MNKTNNIRVLLIEDNPADARLITEMLRDRKGVDFSVETAGRLSDGIKLLSHSNDIDVLLLDLSLPDSGGIKTFENILDNAGNLPIIILTGLNDEMLAIEAVKKGAQDYILKGNFDGDTLIRSIK